MQSSTPVNLENAAYVIAVHTIDGLKLLKDSLCMVTFDVRQRFHATEALADEVRVGLASQSILRHYAFLANDKRISTPPPTRPSSIANILMAILQGQPKLSDTMQSKLSYM